MANKLTDAEQILINFIIIYVLICGIKLLFCRVN